MKTLKLIACIICISSSVVFAQNKTESTVKPGTETKRLDAPSAVEKQEAARAGMLNSSNARMNRYMVQLPHSADQCESVKNQLKEKAANMLMRFDWGCASGEHIGFGLLGGQKEEDITKQLPEGLAKTAKITKVDKATIARGADAQPIQR